MFEESDFKFSIRLLVQVLVFVVGLVVSGFGLFQLFSNDVSASTEDVSNYSQICTKDPEFGRLTVDIGGAVKSPGVYELEVGSRVNDLIGISGGFSSGVDKYYINKVLNLSQRLNDGEKFYIPTLEESLVSKEEKVNLGSSISTSFISINSASSDQLTSLSGIGEKRSQDIIDQRPYDSLNQLVEKGVITESIFENIKNDISL
jgi:competence protein ComEA